MVYYPPISGSVVHITMFDMEPEPPYPGRDRLSKQVGPTNQVLLLDMRMPPDAFPRAARERKKLKNMPDFLHMQGWYGVCEEFRNWVEELDPGVHQFSDKVEVAYKDGRPSEKTYYAINPLRPLSNTVIAERTKPWVSPTGHRRSILESLRVDDEVEIDMSIVGGRHLWLDPQVSSRTWFMSDELARRLTKAKLKKMHLSRCREGRR